MVEGYLPSRGIAYRTNEFEEGRPTLLLVHGFAGSSSAWHEFEKKFEHKYNLVVPDLRGGGLSKRWPHMSNYKLKEFADDLGALLDHLHIKECIAVGYSVGAVITLAFGLEHPKKIKAIVYVSPTYKIHKLWRLRLTRPLMFTAVAFARLFPATPKHTWRVDYSKYKDVGDESVSRISEDIRSTGLRTYLYTIRQWYAFHYDEWWQRLTCPTLILHGKHDSIVPTSHMKELVAKLPHATFVELLEGDHMLVYRNYEWLEQQIEAFIKTI